LLVVTVVGRCVFAFVRVGKHAALGSATATWWQRRGDAIAMV